MRSGGHASVSNNDPQAALSPVVYRETDLASPALARTESSLLYHMNIETILTWPVFEQRGFDQDVDLNYLLSTNTADQNLSRILTTADLESENATRLLQAFLETIHIYNPILVLEKVQADMAEVRLNGLGWDAKSSLLVWFIALPAAPS